MQFELVGFAGKPKNKAGLANVGRLCRWIESTHGVPPMWPNGFPNPPVKGRDPGHHNRDQQNWVTKSGHYGHCHVPANTHWDPAYTADEVAFVMSVPATDVLELVAEKHELATMVSSTKVAGRASAKGNRPKAKVVTKKAVSRPKPKRGRRAA